MTQPQKYIGRLEVEVSSWSEDEAVKLAIKQIREFPDGPANLFIGPVGGTMTEVIVTPDVSDEGEQPPNPRFKT